MQKLNLPSYTFRTKLDAGKNYIFDVTRKKWLRLTPEEWVRQNFIRFLTEEDKFPISRIGTEVTMPVNGRKLRVDAVVYDNFGEIAVLMEFKAPTVTINESVFAQIADYNTKVGARYIVVSNGLSHFVASVEGTSLKLLPDIPSLSDL